MISRVNFALPFYLLPIHISFECFFFDFPHPRLVLVFAFHDQCCQLIWFSSQCGNQKILREIKFGNFAASKTAIFAISGTLYFVDLVDFSLQNVQKNYVNQYWEPKIVLKWLILHFKNLPNWFPVKSWVIEKSWYLHTEHTE